MLFVLKSQQDQSLRVSKSTSQIIFLVCETLFPRRIGLCLLTPAAVPKSVPKLADHEGAAPFSDQDALLPSLLKDRYSRYWNQTRTRFKSKGSQWCLHIYSGVTCSAFLPPFFLSDKLFVAKSYPGTNCTWTPLALFICHSRFVWNTKAFLFVITRAKCRGSLFQHELVGNQTHWCFLTSACRLKFKQTMKSDDKLNIKAPSCSFHLIDESNCFMQ